MTKTTHYLSRKPIYLLSTGFLSESRALPEAAFKTKKAMMAFIKQEYPDARGTNRMEKNELYWEEHNIWLTAEKIILH